MRLHDPTRLYEGEISPGAERFARLVSAVTHAPFVSAVVFVLLNLQADSTAGFAVSTAAALVFASVIPVLIVQHYSVKYGNTDGDVVRREDRVRPLIGGILSYLAGAVVLALIDAPRISTAVMVSYAVSTTVILIISTKWKISVHATGIVGPALVIALVYPPWGLLAFVFVPLTLWSRYVRRKHTPLQLLGGTVLGVFSTLLVLVLLMS